MLQQCNVVNVRMLARCCVWNCNIQNTRSEKKTEYFRLPHFKSLFVHFEHISNMTACYDNCVIDVTSRHIYLLQSFPWRSLQYSFVDRQSMLTNEHIADVVRTSKFVHKSALQTAV